MADPSMLSLFDETSNFLDDLTSSGGGDIGMSLGGDAGMMGGQGNVMMMNNMAPQPQQGQQGFQQQQQPMPGTMHTMTQNQQHGYNQYGAQQTQKLHHMSTNIAVPNQTPQGMMSPQHSQFGSPPPTSPHVTRPSGPYSMSPMHNGPRMSQPQQMNQMNMNQGNMWNQQTQNGPAQPQQMNQSQMFIQQQQQQQNMQPAQNIQQQNMSHMVGQSTGFTSMAHHDYALPANQAPTQRLSHFPEAQQSPVGTGQQNQSFNIQTMSSPPGTNRLSHMPVNSMNNNMNRMSGQMTASTQSFSASSQGVSLLGNTNTGQTQPLHHATFPSDINMQQGQLNSGQQQMNSSQIQHFQFPAVQPNQQPMSQGVTETTPLTHFPNTSPNQNNQFHPQYAGMQQQIRPAASPRPTPPPPSLTPTMPTERLAHLPTPTQGIFQQSSLQQLEQMMPQSNASSTQSHVMQVSCAGQTLNVIKCAPNPSHSQNFQNVQQVSYAPASAQKIAITTLAPSVNTSIATVPTHTSQSTAGMQNSNLQMQKMNVEIQQLQQQIQQFYNMQQTPQTQQKMLDLQERMRSLKAQQQQQLLRERQIQQQQQLIQQPQQQQKGKQIILTIQNPQQQGKKQTIQVTNVQNRPMMTTSTPQGVQVQRIQLRPKAPQNVVVQQQKPQQQQQQPTQIVHSLLTSSPQVQVPTSTKPQIQVLASQPQKSQPQIIIQQKSQVQPSQQQSKPLLVTGLKKGDSQPQHIKIVTITPQKTLKTVKTIISTPVSTPEKTSPTIMTPPSTTPTSQAQPPVSPELNTPPTLTPQESSGLPEPISPVLESSAEDDVDIEAMDGTDRERLLRAQQAQEKANRIVQEALAKAHASGNTSVRVIPSAPIAVDGDLKLEKEKKKKKSGSKKSKEPKPPKEPKEKKEKKAKTPRPKPKSTKKKKPLPTFLKKKKTKKRKTGGMSDDSEPEPRSPVQSDKEDDDLFKRRSSRNTKRKKYLDDLDLQLTDDDKSDGDMPGGDKGAVKPQFFVENPAEEDAVIVEKILGMRTVKKQIPVLKQEVTNADESISDVDVEEDADGNKENKKKELATETIEVEEFFVKYKNFSYLHCEWKAAEDLKDKRIHMKIKRYKQKRLSMGTYFLQLDEDELFNSDYAEVDRILEESVTTDPDTEETVIYYMVKWRSLPYEDSTWELEQDVDKEKVEQFKRFQHPPAEEDRQQIARPTPSEWKKLDKTRTYKNDNTLREYQLEGVNWLTFCYYNKQNCILADEMGLGKTIQSITFLHEIYDYGIRGPFLVIAPLSTIGNWQREFETWTDLNVITYHGTAQSRSMLQEYEMYYKDEDGNRIPDLYKFHALITTYEVIISDVELLSAIDWRATVIDEAHRLKNQKCKLMEGLKVFDLEHRVLLTGTPLQNNVEELFSLLNFLEPSRFNNSEEFLKEFGELKTESQVEKLKLLLKPRMLRRLKEDVEKNLAAKEETIVEVELTNIQKKYYRAILEKNFSFLNKGSGTATNVPNLMNTMMELRKCCNHPYLVNGAEEKIVEDTKEIYGADPWQLFMAMVKASGKLVLIDKLLPKLMAGNHKVLIFSQMIRVLDILEDYLIQKKYLYERIDGRIRGNLRQEAIDRFSKPDSDRFVFLLCTRAGGLGINLTAADTVIIFDSDWNPQNDLQAQARCHRIGQKKSVKVYRLITRNSYEREMFDRASMKLGLDKAVLQSMSGKKDDTAAQAQLSKKEIEDLLRKGAYGAIMEDDAAGDQFCEEDIDLILQRRTQVIQIESEGKGSTFAKASFSVNESRDDIAIDDPNFWTKWAKKAEIDTEVKKNDLIIEAPRARRQTTRFGNQDLLDMSELDTTTDSSANEDGDVGVAPNGVKLKGGKKGKVGRKRKNKNPKVDLDAENTPVEDGVYSRAEFFKVEKNLLVYGWGRWEEILLHGRFKRKLQIKDVQNITRALLVYSLKNYAGDERIKGFIWDLVNPQADKEFKNHSGLSAPVPRGRKGHKARTEASKLADTLQNEMANCDITLDAILTDEGYKKHLQRHANKVLLRVRLLYYLKQEVIGDEAAKVFANYPASQINLPQPNADGEPPIMWWDDEADKSLLIGVFKHGYEKFNIIRQDSCLCFLNRCGPPDGAALLREQNDEDDDPASQQMNESKLLRDDDDMDVDDDDSICPGTPGSSQGKSKAAPIAYETADGKLPFPGPSEINTRLRRVITGYQRNHKKEQLKLQQKEKKLQRRERFEVQLKEREVRKRELQQKWSRREESDFYRIVSTFGVQFDPHIRRYNWETFRQLARLDKKYDDTLTEYFLGFYYMCCRVCKKLKEDAKPPNNLIIEPITEERANRCLARIDLLNKVREEVLLHPKLDERLELCQSSFDMPEWWIPGIHDRDLLIGAARHGLARTDYHILHDPTLSFREIVNNKDLYKYKPPMPFLNPSIPNADLDDTQDGSKANIQSKVESESDMDTDVKQEVKSEIKSEKEDGEVEDEDEGGGRDVKVKPEVKIEESQEVMDKRAMEEKVRAIEAKVKAEMRARHELRDESMDEFDEKPLTSKPEGFGLDGWTPDASLMGDEEMMARSMLNPAIQWPKDRVIFHRLEHICFCIEKGEWPLTRRPAVDSMDTTPSGTPLPIMKPDTPLGDSSRCDTPELFAQGDGLKLKIKKKKRRRKQDIEAERTARLLELYGHQVDSDSQQDSLCGMRTPTDSLTNDTNDDTDNDHGDISVARDSKHGIGHTRTPIFMGEGQKKRGRKRKMDRMPDDHSAMAAAEQVALAMAQATAKKPAMHRAHKLTTLAPEARVPVVNIEDGSRLSGEEAPSRLELEEWLDNHPGYMVDLPDDQIEPAVQFDQQFFIDKRKKRRPRLDPAKLDLDNLTGEENVSVVNKVTGKRITGAKAPPLKHLAEWLTQNANFFVDPKWAHLVKEKGNLPEALHSRILFPSEKRRGRPPTASSSVPRSSQQSPYPSASQMNALAMANPALMKLGMGIPFGALPSLGMNPMFSMTNMAAFGLPMTTAGPTKTTVTESTTKNDSSDSDDKTASSAGSFPLMYNPMLYNSIMAAQMGNFSLPANIPTSFATLAQAQAQMLNGAAAAAAAAAAVGKNNSESEDNPEQVEAQDLSIKKQKKHSPKMKSTKHKSKVVMPEVEIEEGEILNLATKKRCAVPEELKVVPTATKSENEGDSDDQS